MRDIKFRGKAKGNNTWCYGYLGYSMARKEFYIMDDILDFSIPIYEETIGEYTGFKDKNDFEIYEGDILEFYGYPGQHYYIEISKDSEPPYNFFFGYVKKPNATVCGISDGISTILEDIPIGSKIIGNIYDKEEK